MKVKLADRGTCCTHDNLEGFAEFRCQVEVLGVGDALEPKHEQGPRLDSRLTPWLVEPVLGVLVCALKQVSVDLAEDDGADRVAVDVRLLSVVAVDGANEKCDDVGVCCD